MKRTALICLTFLLLGGLSSAQTLNMTIKKPAKVKIARVDTCIGQSLDGVKVYRGPKGGLYYFDSLGKKHYIKKS